MIDWLANIKNWANKGFFVSLQAYKNHRNLKSEEIV
jgi:hypothetical protein